MRLIDADALKEALKANCGTLCNDKNTDWCEYCCPHNDFEDLIDNAPIADESDIQSVLNKKCMTIVTNEYLIALQGIRTQGEWIPVSEKLPDLYEVVLVTDECGKVFEYERRPLDDEGNVCRKWSFLGRNIIAWMPMPEPYKEEEE